ncbi:MAG: hypothetical protein ACRC10_04425 [Thermoguttaceae bacterium]
MFPVWQDGFSGELPIVGESFFHSMYTGYTFQVATGMFKKTNPK